MISRLRGTLLTRDEGTVEVATAGGVVYEVEVPLTVAGKLPPEGQEVEILTHPVIRDDLQALYGFVEEGERVLFQRILGVQSVGARLALNMLSTYDAPRLAQVLAERNVGALVQVSGVGKKTAERLVLELADKMEDLALAGGSGPEAPEGVQAAVQALVSLGMSFQQADRAVRAVLKDGEPVSTEELIRKALAQR